LKKLTEPVPKLLKARLGTSRRVWRCSPPLVNRSITSAWQLMFHSASEPKRLNWLIANVKEFGFSWEVVPSEPWHLRYVNGDNAPASVKAWMEKNGVSAPAGGAPAPASGGDDIKKLQEALKAKGFYKGEINGQKDSATDEAIKAFKVANKLAADSVAGPKVKELLGL
jgi:hypothetical protein